MRLGSRSRTLAALLGVSALLAGCSDGGVLGVVGDDGPTQSSIPTALVIDGSGSMRADDAGGTRIDAAKTAAAGYIDALPEGTEFSLWSYGLTTSNAESEHEAGCRDTTTVIESGGIDHDAAKTAVDAIAPSGWSPIAATMRQAGQALPADTEASLVVVTDGEDTCGRPTICEVAEELHRSHPLLRIDAVGFMVDDEELSCAAETTGGLYVTADNTEQLTARLAASRDTELSRTTLTGRGFQGIEVGATHADITAAHDDFPALSEGEAAECASGDCGSGTTTIIRWRDCEWHFTGDGVLYLIDPGKDSRTIDGFAVGDDADDLATFYGDAVQESAGTFDGDEVTVRWYRADADLGLAWRVVVDAKDTIRAIVLCRCLPGTTGGADTAASAASGAGEGTEVVIYDVFNDDGSVREPFQSRVTQNSDLADPIIGSVECTKETSPDSKLHDCGLSMTSTSFGECSVFGDRVFCPDVTVDGEVRITEFPLGGMGEGNEYEQTQLLQHRNPKYVVTVDGEHFRRAVEPGTEFHYLQGDPWTIWNGGVGLVAPMGEDPFDRSSAFWTAERSTDYMATSGETVRIARVYYFE